MRIARSLRPLLVAAGASFALAACADAPPGPGPTQQSVTTPGRYIATFSPGHAAAGKAAVAAAGGSVLLELGELHAAAVQIPEAAVFGLSHNPNITHLEADPKRYPLAQSVPYGISAVQADQVSTEGVSGMTVCIIDSGYDGGHEDLPQGVHVSGNDSAAGPWNEDGCGHGTHVAGTIAALDNAVGVVGVMPAGSPNLHIERVFGNNCGWAYASELIDAAYKCRDAGADVISMSLGCASGGNRCYSQTEDNGFADLYDNHGMLSVAAASNDGKGWYSYPASYDSVISVAAVNSSGAHASFSNSNDAVELSAPGVGVLSTVPQGCYYCDNSTNLYEAWNGTSMATPHVAGVAALVWSTMPSATNAQVREAITATAQDLGAAGRDRDTGYGLVQAADAADYLGGGVTPECAVDADCDDGNECTDDSCNAGSCSSSNNANTCAGGAGLCCSGSCTTPECDSDADCGDGNECTNDSCSNPGTCGATCQSSAASDETSCSGGICCSGSCVAELTCELTCEPLAASCDSDADCCSGKCKGKPGNKTCK